MKTLSVTFIWFCFISLQVNAQDIYFDPFPIISGQPTKLYVDISSATCNCPELQDADPINNPIFIWTWDPNEDRPSVNGQDVTNGSWDASNPNLIMANDPSNPNLWYYNFLNVTLSEFYTFSEQNIANSGIYFLLKEENGAPPDMPEQKSADMSIDVSFDEASSISEYNENVLTFETFPNPTSDLIRVQLILKNGSSQNILLRISTPEGQIIKELANLPNLEMGVELDLNSLSKGFYLILLLQNDIILATKKLMVN